MGLSTKSVPSNVVGLDIGTELIKIVEAHRTKNGITVTGLGFAPTPVGSIENGIVIDPQALGNAIKRLMRESNIRAKHVVSIIPGQTAVVSRVIEVPKMTKNELAETMKWEVERHVPFSPTQIVMDFAPIEKPNTPPDAPSMEVLLAVAQEDAVYSHVKTVQTAGLAPVAIDVQPLAVSRGLINASSGQLPFVTAIVNVGASSTDVGVYEGSTLVFPGPPLPIAGVNFTRAISEALGVPVEEAERLKREFAVVDDQLIQAIYGNMQPEPEPEPTTFDSSYQLYDPSFHAAGPEDLQPEQQDYSPFDLGAPQQTPVEPTEQKLDISAEDVFDLGGGEQNTNFKPVFDLDDPDLGSLASPQTNANVFDLGADPMQAPTDQYDTTHYAMDQDATAFSADQAIGDTQPADNAVPDSSGYDFGRSVGDAIAPVLVELATEIRRSLEYYVSRYQSHPEQIFLCGGTAKLRGLDKFLAVELGIPVIVADPLSNLTMNCPKYTPQHLSEIAPLFPVSIGLAIREMVE